jgi:uncharacterized protein (DUF736 family)
MSVRVYTLVNKEGQLLTKKVYLTREDARQARAQLKNPRDFRVAYKSLDVDSGWNTIR